MTPLPPDLARALGELRSGAPRRVTPLQGGMICRAARVDFAQGEPLFVKWAAEPPPRFFEVERAGLGRLARAGALRVPQVLGSQDSPPGDGTSFLALEWVPPRPPSDPERFARRFGEALARQHRETRAPDGCFGLDMPNYIGLLPQDNTPHARWPDFYRERRLLPQIAIAREKGRMPPERERGLMRVVERLDALLDGLPARPVLLHGDLWSGNLMSAGDEPVVVDPAVYYGEREMEIAYMELFSGFPPAVLASYRAAFPLDGGYARRRALHQLYPLLVHLNHFGEPYGADVERVCRACAGA